MALITRDDLKTEMQLKVSDDDTLLDSICAAILDLFDQLTGRTWAETAFTEHHDVEDYQDKIFLENYPVNQTATFEVYDDPNWDFLAADLISSDDYKVDYARGIIHYGSYFFGGPRSVKVVYTAGYADGSLPLGIKQALVRQAVVWFRQAKQGTWDLQSITIPAGGGGASIERHARGLMPEFEMMVARESR